MAEVTIISRVSGKKPTVDKLIRQLKFWRIFDYWMCNEQSPRIVKQLGDYKEEAAPALPILYKIASSKSDYRLRGYAIEAIGKIGCSESRRFLLDILKKRTDQRDRHAAIKALRYFKKKELKEYIPYFKEITLNKKENRNVRHEALKILAAILEEPKDFLMSFISPVKDDVLHLTAVDYLGRLRVEEALPILGEIILTLEKNYQIVEYLLAIAEIERDIFGYGITNLELMEEKRLLDPLFQQPKFRRLFYSIRSEQAGKLNLTFEDYLDLLIEEWENQIVEFKACLYYCTYTKKRSTDLFYKFVQTVAAFANTNPGFIIIGVDNEKNVIGVKSDLKYWGSDNPKDKYKNEFTNQLIRHLNTKNLDFIDFDFKVYKNEELFFVTVNRSEDYIFVNDDEFYIRVKDSDRKLSIKESGEYIKSDTQKLNKKI